MRVLILAFLVVAAMVSPAVAQPIDLGPPALQWAGGITAPTPVIQIGFDSVTNDPCLVGKTATCFPPPTGTITADQGTAGADPWLITGAVTLPSNTDTAALITLAAAGASTVNSADQTNASFRGVQVGVNLTVMTTATVTINIQGKDAASGQYYTILASTALATTGFANLTVYPGAATTANASSPQPLPKTWRVQAVVVGATAAATGTVGASVIN